MTKSVVLLTVILVMAALPASAQPATASLQLGLDRPVELTIKDPTPIGEVFSRLSKATGVKFVVSEDALDCLPYGDQTRLSIELKDVTARSALPRMLGPQALRWEIKGDAVEIVPTEALYRMGRRVSYDELRLLGAIYSQELKPTFPGSGVIDQLRRVVENKDVDIAFHVEADKAALFAKAERVLPGTAAAWLDMLCHGQGTTWVVNGSRIAIIDKKTQIQRQLQRTVSLRYQNTSLTDVLNDLARKARIRLVMDPGVMNYLPPDSRSNFGLIKADATIDQVLQVISGETGLMFVPTEDGLKVEASQRLIDGFLTSRARPRTPFFVRMNLPGPAGLNAEVYLRAEELPDELVAAIQAEKDKLIRKLTEQYGLKKVPALPSTEPATAP